VLVPIWGPYCCLREQPWKFLRGQWNCLAECVLRLDRCLGGLSLGHDWVGGGARLRPASTHGALWTPSVCQRLTTLHVTVKSLLDVSPNGDDTTWPCHLQDQVGIMWDRHKLGVSAVPRKHCM
jgi:hypothetical protein